MIGGDAFFNSRSKLLAELSSRYAVPAIYEYREFTDLPGGLMSYSGSINEIVLRWAGIYTGRILQGSQASRPAGTKRSTTVELIVNLKTAKALGITVPLSLLGRADELIE